MSIEPKPLTSAAAPPPVGTLADFEDAVAAEVRRQLAARGVSAEVRKPIELPADLYANRLVDAPTVAKTLGYSLAHFRRLYRTGKIMAPVRINGRKVGWPASALQSLLK